jgi:ADP-ribosylglycohydrolase
LSRLTHNEGKNGQVPDSGARLLRAYQSLEGLSCGDAFGQRFFGKKEIVQPLIRQRVLPSPPWLFTDDTMMALSVVSTLEKHERIEPSDLALSFATNYDPSRGYGPAMHGLLARIREGNPWRSEAQALFGGQGSFGNGSAMRVAPVGAYFADDLGAVVEQAELSAVTTHGHSEAVAGAIAVALAAGIAWQYRGSEVPDHTEFLEQVYQKTPASEVRRGIRKALELPRETSMDLAVAMLGNGFNVTAQDTVPFALWVAASHLDDYEEALWATVSGLGDRDTTCAIVGGIVVMCAGLESIPKQWVKHREPISPIS